MARGGLALVGPIARLKVEVLYYENHWTGLSIPASA